MVERPYKYDRLIIRAVHGELDRWGRWIDAHSHYQGYPRDNILVTYIGSDIVPVGHRVLMQDMPAGIWKTHHRVLKLSEPLRDVVCAWYMARVKEDGTLWKMGEKAEIMGISVDTFRQRLRRGKLGLAAQP